MNVKIKNHRYNVLKKNALSGEVGDFKAARITH